MVKSFKRWLSFACSAALEFSGLLMLFSSTQLLLLMIGCFLTVFGVILMGLTVPSGWEGWELTAFLLIFLALAVFLASIHVSLPLI